MICTDTGHYVNTLSTIKKEMKKIRNWEIGTHTFPLNGGFCPLDSMVYLVYSSNFS